MSHNKDTKDPPPATTTAGTTATNLAMARTSTPQDGTFHSFPQFPGEIQDMIWDAAARTLNLDRGHVHYITEEIRGLVPDPVEADYDPYSVGATLRPDPTKSVFSTDTALWAVCHRSHAVMHRRFATSEWYRHSAWSERGLRTTDETTRKTIGQWHHVPLGAAWYPGIWMRPRKDLVVFQGNATAQTTPPAAYRKGGLHALAGPALCFPEVVLGHADVLNANLANVAFTVGPDLWRALGSMPHEPGPRGRAQWATWTSKLICMGVLRPHVTSSSWPQLWFVDPKLHVPGGWAGRPPPEGRAVFQAEGYRLVEVRLEDYGVELNCLQWVLRCIEEVDMPIDGYSLQPFLRLMVKYVMRSEDRSLVEGATDFVAFGLAAALDMNFERRYKYTVPGAPVMKVVRMLRSVKVLAVDSPAGSGRSESRTSEDKYEALWRAFLARGYTWDLLRTS